MICVSLGMDLKKLCLASSDLMKIHCIPTILSAGSWRAINAIFLENIPKISYEVGHFLENFTAVQITLTLFGSINKSV